MNYISLGLGVVLGWFVRDVYEGMKGGIDETKPSSGEEGKPIIPAS
jgi:hypothetical protein